MEAGFEFFAQQGPRATAIIDATGRNWSRIETARLARQTARAFLQLGLSPGDVVAVVARNRSEYLVVYLATQQAGLSMVPVNWHLAAPELAYILEDSGAKAIFVDSRLGALVTDALLLQPSLHPTLVSFGRLPGFTDFDELIAAQSPAPLERGLPGQVLQYTSATTGRPKAVVVPPTSRPSLERRIQLHISMGVELDDATVNLCVAPLYHAAPLDIAATALHMGHTVLVLDGFEPEGCLQLMAQHRVGTAFMVPMMFLRFLKLPKDIRSRYSTEHLKWVNHGGAPCPPEVKRQMIEWWGPVLWDAYGSSEGGGGTICSPQEWLRYPGTVGRPLPGSQCKILNDAGDELLPSEVGLIYLTRAAGDRFAYKGDAAKTDASYRGAFFTVGDLGYLNDEGYLFVSGRNTDMIISGGVKIYPAELEQALAVHPLVADCAVIGIPDAVLGEAVKVIVQLMPGHEGAPEMTAALIRFLGSRVAAIKLPRRFEYARELPRDPSGKLYKRRLGTAPSECAVR